MDKIRIHKILIADKVVIIRKAKKGIEIAEVALKYGVSDSTIYALLREWGLGKKQLPKNYYRHSKKKEIKISREKKIAAFKAKLSPELRAKMAENTRINNKYMKLYSTVQTGKDKFLVQEILKGPEAIK